MKKHTTVIGDVTYATERFSMTEGLILLPKIVALFGYDMLKLIFSLDGEERSATMKDPSVLALLLTSIAKNASQNQGLLVVKELLANTSADKVKIGDATVEGNVVDHFDTHFDSRYQHLLEVVLWVATCNFLEP